MNTEATFHEKRAAFFVSMQKRGMTQEGANYCISIGKRLRKIYAESTRALELEDEALTSLQNMLDRLPCPVDNRTRNSVPWSSIAGGIDEDDKTVLYIIPPHEAPAAVPLPDEAPANAVEQILDQWGKPQPPKKPEVTFEQRPEVKWQMLEEIMQRSGLETMQGISRSTHPPIWTNPEHSEAVKRYTEELEKRAKGEGWSELLRQTELYRKFVNTLARAMSSKKMGNIMTANMLQGQAKDMYEELKLIHAASVREIEARVAQPQNWPALPWPALPSPAETQRSLDHLREKEQQQTRRAKKYRK